MLLVNDRLARRIWLTSPNFSMSGKLFATWYIAFRNSRATRSTSKSSNVETLAGPFFTDSRCNDSRFTGSAILLHHPFQILGHFRQRFEPNLHGPVGSFRNERIHFRKLLVFVREIFPKLRAATL